MKKVRILGVDPNPVEFSELAGDPLDNSALVDAIESLEVYEGSTWFFSDEHSENRTATRDFRSLVRNGPVDETQRDDEIVCSLSSGDVYAHGDGYITSVNDTLNRVRLNGSAKFNAWFTAPAGTYTATGFMDIYLFHSNETTTFKYRVEFPLLTDGVMHEYNKNLEQDQFVLDDGDSLLIIVGANCDSVTDKTIIWHHAGPTTLSHVSSSITSAYREEEIKEDIYLSRSGTGVFFPVDTEREVIGSTSWHHMVRSGPQGESVVEADRARCVGDGAGGFGAVAWVDQGGPDNPVPSSGYTLRIDELYGKIFVKESKIIFESWFGQKVDDGVYRGVAQYGIINADGTVKETLATLYTPIFSGVGPHKSEISADVDDHVIDASIGERPFLKVGMQTTSNIPYDTNYGIFYHGGPSATLASKLYTCLPERNIPDIISLSSHAALKTIADANGLSAGQRYKIPYLNTYVQPYSGILKKGKYDAATITAEQIIEQTEYLILTANGSNTFNEEVGIQGSTDTAIYDFTDTTVETGNEWSGSGFDYIGKIFHNGAGNYYRLLKLAPDGTELNNAEYFELSYTSAQNVRPGFIKRRMNRANEVEGIGDYKHTRFASFAPNGKYYPTEYTLAAETPIPEYDPLIGCTEGTPYIDTGSGDIYNCVKSGSPAAIGDADYFIVLYRGSQGSVFAKHTPVVGLYHLGVDITTRVERYPICTPDGEDSSDNSVGLKLTGNQSCTDYSSTTWLNNTILCADLITDTFAQSGFRNNRVFAMAIEMNFGAYTYNNYFNVASNFRRNSCADYRNGFWYSEETCSDNTIKKGSNNLLFSGTQNYVTLGQNARSSIIRKMHGTVIGTDAQNNYYGPQCDYCTMDSSYKNNKHYGVTSYCKFGKGCEDNVISVADCSYNNCDDGFSANSITAAAFTGNTIGKSFSTNVIGEGFLNNIIPNGVSNKTFPADFAGKQIMLSATKMWTLTVDDDGALTTTEVV